MPERKAIVLTGGGTAGHVMPHLALLKDIRAQGWEPFYIGTSGIEKQILGSTDVSFYSIPAGKLRRYFSLKNITDVFKIFAGFLMSLFWLVRLRPRCVFSKGGFVSVPVAYAAKLLGIPVVSHESDMTPGLATRLIRPIANTLLYSFPDSKRYFPEGVCVGLPVRSDIHGGDRQRGLMLAGFSGQKPVLLIMGGSLGASRLNRIIGDALPELTKRYSIFHIVGRGKLGDTEYTGPDYKKIEFVDSDLADIFAMTDLAISRAGANAIFELLELKIPMLLVPLTVGSRGDQVDNANCFVQLGVAQVADEVALTSASLVEAVEKLAENQSDLVREMDRHGSTGATSQVMRELRPYMEA